MRHPSLPPLASHSCVLWEPWPILWGRLCSVRPSGSRPMKATATSGDGEIPDRGRNNSASTWQTLSPSNDVRAIPLRGLPRESRGISGIGRVAGEGPGPEDPTKKPIVDERDRVALTSHRPPGPAPLALKRSGSLTLPGRGEGKGRIHRAHCRRYLQCRGTPFASGMTGTSCSARG